MVISTASSQSMAFENGPAPYMPFGSFDPRRVPCGVSALFLHSKLPCTNLPASKKQRSNSPGGNFLQPISSPLTFLSVHVTHASVPPHQHVINENKRSERLLITHEKEERYNREVVSRERLLGRERKREKRGRGVCVWVSREIYSEIR